MKTDDLANMLARNVGAVRAPSPARLFTMALGLGMGVAFALMIDLLGIRSDLANAVRLPMFWAKSGFAAATAVAALIAVMRLSRPGARLGGIVALVALPSVAMWIFGASEIAVAAPRERLALLLGATWIVCPFLIALLSAPIFAAVICAIRGMAPTRLSSAGAAAGILSGAAGAFVYSIHCPEMALPFLATWYVLGMLIPAVAGLALGPRLLRWH